MAGQIIFFKKNRADYENTLVTVTASQGTDTQNYILDRSNRTMWGTSGSVDSDNTTVEVNLGDVRTIDSILLLRHNFKNFKIQYWDELGLAWSDFTSAIHPTTNTSDSNYYSVTAVLTSKILLTIYGTMVADSDKNLCQFIATSKIGQLDGWPVIGKPTLSRNIVQNKMLSGKAHLIQNVGAYSAKLTVKSLSSDADWAIFEALYNSPEGFLFWPCGGDETQFRTVREGYRMEDIYLVRCKSDQSPEWYSGLYKTGIKLDLDLVEVIT